MIDLDKLKIYLTNDPPGSPVTGVSDMGWAVGERGEGFSYRPGDHASVIGAILRLVQSVIKADREKPVIEGYKFIDAKGRTDGLRHLVSDVDVRLSKCGWHNVATGGYSISGPEADALPWCTDCAAMTTGAAGEALRSAAKAKLPSVQPALINGRYVRLCPLAEDGKHDYEPTSDLNTGNAWLVPTIEFTAVCRFCGDWSKP